MSQVKQRDVLHSGRGVGQGSTDNNHMQRVANHFPCYCLPLRIYSNQ